jgi:hypothetical protein
MSGLNRRLRSPLSTVLVIVATLNACTSWRVQSVTPAQLVAEQQPHKVRLRGQDGTRTELRGPFVRGDSLLGLTKGDTAGVALNEVQVLEVRRFDWLKTAGLTVLTVGVTLGVACAMTCGWETMGFSFAP